MSHPPANLRGIQRQQRHCQVVHGRVLRVQAADAEAHILERLVLPRRAASRLAKVQQRGQQTAAGAGLTKQKCWVWEAWSIN